MRPSKSSKPTKPHSYFNTEYANFVKEIFKLSTSNITSSNITSSNITSSTITSSTPTSSMVSLQSVNELDNDSTSAAEFCSTLSGIVQHLQDEQVCINPGLLVVNIDSRGHVSLRSTLVTYNIKKSLQHCKKAMIVVPVILDVPGKYRTTHANLMFLNMWQKRAEIFEPFGKSKMYEQELQTFFINYIKSLGLKNWQFESSSTFCPRGPQKRQRITTTGDTILGATCASWSLYYAYVKMNFPMVETSDIFNVMYDSLKEFTKRNQKRLIPTFLQNDMDLILLQFIRTFKQWMLSVFPKAKCPYSVQ